MATKTAKADELEKQTEEATDSPLIDSVNKDVKKLLQKAKERGYVTYDEINEAMPQDQVTSEKIEDTMAMLSEMVSLPKVTALTCAKVIEFRT